MFTWDLVWYFQNNVTRPDLDVRLRYKWEDPIIHLTSVYVLFDTNLFSSVRLFHFQYINIVNRISSRKLKALQICKIRGLENRLLAFCYLK